MERLDMENADISAVANMVMHHKRLYYLGIPEISDDQYDRMEETLRALSPKHPVLNFVGSPVAGTSPKAAHQKPMLSLQKTYHVKDLNSWRAGQETLGTWKIDGNSLSLVYSQGQLTMVKTRGDGQYGEDVTDKSAWVSDILLSLKQPWNIEVRGELYCSTANFILLSEQMNKLGLERPSNPRNIVSGLLGRKSHTSLLRYFNFFAFEVIDPSGQLSLVSEGEVFKWLEESGFPVPEYQILEFDEQVFDFLQKVKSVMQAGKIGLDGAVFSLNQHSAHQKLGNTSHHPRYKMSFKWQGEKAISVIQEIQWSTSRFGAVTPVAIIDPVMLSGAQIRNVSLHNALYVKKYLLKPGDRIEIVRSGEVIPKFISVVTSVAGDPRLPEYCPSCFQPLVDNNVRLKCTNDACPAKQFGSILFWIKAVGIEDLSEKRLTSLIELGLIKEIPDLYKLTKEDFLKLPLTQEKMAIKLVAAIAKKSCLPMIKFFNGLGIEGMGEASWKRLLNKFPNLQEVRALSKEQIEAVDGFAEKTATQISRTLIEKSCLLERLIAVGVKPQNPQSNAMISQPLAGKKIAITGSLSVSRKQITTLIESGGGHLVSAISKKTDLLLCSNPDGNSSKLTQAKKLGIEIMNEPQLMIILSNSIKES